MLLRVANHFCSKAIGLVFSAALAWNPTAFDKTADETAKTIIASLGQLPKLARKSITFDNGTEFAKHQKLTDQIGVKTWFCDPHSPWQRGSIENTTASSGATCPGKLHLISAPKRTSAIS